MRKRTVLSLTVAFVPVLAVATTSPSADADTRSTCHLSGNVETCHIDEPVVNSVWHDYPAIQLRPCDKVTIKAGGCVQTGGHGKTWKRYVDPIGGGSSGLYAGLVRVPGVFDGDWQQDCGGLTCNRSAKHLKDVVGVPFTIPHDVGTGTGIAGHPNGPRPLTLGYTDDVYRDNSYSGHDDGTNDQCKNVGNAFVDVTIEHAASCPAQQNDGVKDGDESDVDCGGTAAPACADGKACGADRDCKTNSKCVSGRCLAPPPCEWCQYEVGVTTCSGKDHSGNGGCAGIDPGQSITVVPKNGATVEVIAIVPNPTDVHGHATVTVRTCKSQYMSFDLSIPGHALWGAPNPAPPVCSNTWQNYARTDAPTPPPQGGGGGTSLHTPPPPHNPPPPPPRGGGGRTQRQ